MKLNGMVLMPILGKREYPATNVTRIFSFKILSQTGIRFRTTCVAGRWFKPRSHQRDLSYWPIRSSCLQCLLVSSVMPVNGPSNLALVVGVKVEGAVVAEKYNFFFIIVRHSKSGEICILRQAIRYFCSF